MSNKKITLLHPDAANREDGGVWVADTEAEALQAEAVGYRRQTDDPAPAGKAAGARPEAASKATPSS